MVVSKEQIIQWFILTYDLMKENEEYLTELDSAIGDADHGKNMVRGFGRVKERMSTVSEMDIGTILKTVSMTLMSTSGGACGQLYANYFLRGGAAVAAKEELDEQDLLELLQAGIEGVFQRGRALPGEKTIIDTFTPAAEAFKDAIDAQLSLADAISKCLEAAEKGVENTIGMKAKKGRASYLGERSVGHQDP
ncbi:MAG: dihydroxyacetone kinase subunit DhaL, partial [Chloroflexota bacterium]